ncbi:MAG: hypothetical protein V1896_02970 [Candidatus Zambryskibacteria bacterium]
MDYLFFQKYKKITALLIILAFLSSSFSPFFARKAEAQWVTLDPANLVQTILGIVKDFGLDALAWMIVNMIIERMSAATVNWINSGFKGQPAYLTDPEAYFLNMSDQIAGRYIFSNPKLSSLCGPLQAKVKLALTRSYLNEQQWSCTPSLIGSRFTDFMGDFSKGGWDTFFELTQNTQNTPIGAYLQAEVDMNNLISVKQEATKADLNQGGGMLSWKSCEQYGPDVKVPWTGDPAQAPTIPGPCLKEKTNTPGSVINAKLNDQLGAGNQKLAAADEINEMVSALLNQLIGKIFSSVSKGLRGMTEQSPTESSPFTDMLTAGTKVDYFGNTQDTSTADESAAIDPYAGMPQGSEPQWPADESCDPSIDPNCGARPATP